MNLLKQTLLNAGWVRLFDVSDSNTSLEKRDELVSTIASLSRGNIEPEIKTGLMEKLIEWEHSKPLEFIRGYKDHFGIQYSLRNCNPNFTDYKTHRQNIVLFMFKVPIFVARQMMTHRISWLELSRRYVTPDKVPFEYWFPETIGGKPIDQKELIKRYENIYYWFRDNRKLSNEIARTFLPLSLYTYMYGMFDVPAYKNFIYYRLQKSTQEQTRMVAETMKALVDEYQPEFGKE